MCVPHMPGREMSNSEGREGLSQYTHWEEQVKGPVTHMCIIRVLIRGLGLNREIADKGKELSLIKWS